LHLNDFGRAKSYITNENIINTSFDTKICSFNHMAPEIHLKPTETADITKQDVWAIGVIAYEICNFTLPFTGSNALRAVVEDPSKPFVHQGYSDELKGLID
jgi:serine/threonine protein kinase